MQFKDICRDEQLFKECVAPIANACVYKGAPPVKTVAPRLDGQSVSCDGHENVQANLLEVEPQMNHAKTFVVPDKESLSQPHLRAAAEYVAGFHDTPQLLEQERESKLQALFRSASKLSACNPLAHSFASPLGKPLAKRFNVALLMVMVSAVGYPDTQLPFDIVQGVPNFGDIPASGSHAPCEIPAKLEQLDPFYARKLIGSIRRKAARADSAQQQGYAECYAKTMSEVEQGWMVGPFSKEECDAMFPDGWHPSERFAQYRYEGSPCRPCDNFRTSGVNDFNSYHERIVCENAGFPSRVGKYFYSLFSDMFDSAIPAQCCMSHGTDDLTKAYRQCVVRDHAHNVVAIWNPHSKRVDFFVLRGLPFGSAAAVLQFNRYSQFMAYFLTAYFGICCASYYDDYDVVEPLYSVHFAQNVLWRLHERVGFMLDKDKHVRAAVSGNAFLGVVTDFSSFLAGKIYLRISAERRRKIVAMLLALLNAKSISAAQASSLRGKLYFCMLTAFNKVGRGPLYAFTERQYSHATHITPALMEAILFFLELIPNMAPRCIDMVSALRSTLIIWSDAMYEASRGALGFVAFDPDDGQYYYSAYVVPSWVYLFFRALQTYIGQLEILAVLFAYLTLPKRVVCNRPVLHYIDNTSSMAGAIKGYSSKSDSAFLLTILHLLFAMLNIAPWFAYVASKANCSDGPSRLDFSFAAGVLKAQWLEPIYLTFAQWTAGPRAWISSKPPRAQRDSGAARRARKKQRTLQDGENRRCPHDFRPDSNPVDCMECGAHRSDTCVHCGYRRCAVCRLPI